MSHFIRPIRTSLYVVTQLFLLHAVKAPVDQGVLGADTSRPHSETPQSAGLLWTSDRPDAETST